MAVQRHAGRVQRRLRDGDGVPVHLHPRAHFGQLLRHRLDAVGFLEPQPSRVADDGGPAAEGGQREQHRAQIRAVRQIDLGGPHQAALKVQPVGFFVKFRAAAL